MIQTLFGSLDEEQKPSFIERMKQAVSRTRENLAERIEDVVSIGKEIDRSTLDDLEATLIGADLGTTTTHEVLEKLRDKADRISSNDAYTNGVHSTLIMAGDMFPGHRYVTEFCQYRPDAEEADAVSAWNTHIGRDAAEKVERYRRVLKAQNQVGEIFRYHDLQQFVADLDY